MKEVKFRWVDRYLIHLTISEKFLITFWCPLVFIAFLTWYLLADGHDQAMQLRVDQLKGRVETTAQLVSQQPTLTLPADLVLTPGAATGLSQQGDIYRYGASAGQAGVVSGTLDTSHYALWDGQGTTLTIIAVLAALLALITHYLMTFVSGALYSTNKALQTVANGDLTFRLNFFPVRDEFSILAGSIDTFTDRQHKIVQLVEESAEALTMAADEFREHASDGETLARAQRQHMDSLAAAMEQMSAAIREVARNANDTLLQTLVRGKLATPIATAGRLRGVRRRIWQRLGATLNNMGGIFTLLGAMNGTAFSMAAVFALGVQPYIYSSIIIQLLTVAIPALERMQRDGGEAVVEGRVVVVADLVEGRDVLTHRHSPGRRTRTRRRG